LKQIAKSGGFLDPVALLAQLNRFAQPSEVAAPIELLRAGAMFHARGLINARIIQGNLDWIWPYWVRRQFDPLDPAFVPRSFALTHVNLTHRNWTAVGLPGHTVYPIVDARGLVTPFFDGWSLDAWIIDEAGNGLLPSGSRQPRQRQSIENDRLTVETEFVAGGRELFSAVSVFLDKGLPACRIRYRALSQKAAAFVVALRPFNPEGISFIYQIGIDAGKKRWTVNEGATISLDPPAGRHAVSEYREGDVYAGLLQRKERLRRTCDIGMASAAAVYPLQPGSRMTVCLDIPLDKDPEAGKLPAVHRPDPSWNRALEPACRLAIPDGKMKTVYDAAVHTLVLLSPLEIYPGPFYYRRFWFRDAVFILNALLSLGLHDRAERAIEHALRRQTLAGYFESQKGEWDSNGQVLWIFERFGALTGRSLPDNWLKAARKAARWILRKRLPADAGGYEAGLLPAGFSAEHLGNNDFYYWDDFWAIAGLRAAAKLLENTGRPQTAEAYRLAAEHFMLCVERSLLRSGRIRRRNAIPASPYRRMDAGAVGSIVVDYPLQLWPPGEKRLLETLAYLLENSFIDDAFFQDMTHSGFNIYLTLHCAQCLLRAGDPRYLPMVEKVARLATPTGHWPEAVHPQTLGGCMGDGQHAWAAAEWVLMMHRMFAAEEGDQLILLRGLPEKWLDSRSELKIGPLHTRFGSLDIRVRPDGDGPMVEWQARWRQPPASISVQLPGTAALEWHDPETPDGRLKLQPDSR
jgi:hypothetical protein